MSAPVSDRNLLFGILALQMDFISRGALIKAMNAWVLEKTKPLGQILTEHGAMAADIREYVEGMIDKHVEVHGNDVQKSLAAVSSIQSVRRELEQIGDAGLHASLAHVSSATPPEDDPQGTRSYAVGLPTSGGTRFRILRPHARGGLGEVFVAHDEELNREVALKEIQDRHAGNPESRARFLLEAEITGGLEHPGIVPVYGLGTYADGRPFYAMRFIKGDSLKDAIARYHKSSSTDFADFTDKRQPGSMKSVKSAKSVDHSFTVEFRQLLGRFIDVCNAIAYAHSRGVLHRDLKPGNIMLGNYGETLVVDWGLAKAGVGRIANPSYSAEEQALQPASAAGSAETQAGTAISTPQFMSPEQAAGRLDLLGPASDVYSLGATLYCLLTGKAPFADKDTGVVLQKVQRGEFPTPSQLEAAVPPALEAICLKAMARQSEDRYVSPRALADDIEHWLADEPVSAWPEPVTVKAGRWMRRHKPLVSGAAAAVLVGLIGLTAGTIWYHDHQADAARNLALTEQAVRQSLEQARLGHDQLLAALKKTGGVQELLNQPARWQGQITSARGDWKRAKALADNTQAEIDPELTSRMQQLDQDLVRTEADYELALRLENVRLDKATWIDGKFDHAQAAREYPLAFSQAGLAVEPGRQNELGARRLSTGGLYDLNDPVASLDLKEGVGMRQRLVYIVIGPVPVSA
jgi:serine/threonine protein kinase